jgi:prolyl-tRNA synthetase
MRMSKLFFQTLRESPAEAEITSHQLLLRAGMVRQVTAGIFEYLPLGQRVKHKAEAIIREEMNAIGGQEVTLPIVQPAELWQRSGRWQQIGDDMVRLQDRNGRDLCLGMTHEEVVAELAAQLVRSYRQLPFMLYQIQTKFRDEPRPRGGLIRVREFTMKDGYSFHADFADLDAFYQQVYQAYFNIFHRCGLDVIAVRSDSGMMGGTLAHEFMALTPVGEDTLLLCDACGYQANRQIAAFRKPEPPLQEPLPLEEVHTPGIDTIDGLARFLGIPASQTAKAIFLVAEIENLAKVGNLRKVEAEEQFVFAVLRGDMALNETKLSNALKARRLRPATHEEIRAIGAEPGYGSPIGVDRGRMLLAVDDLIPRSPNLVAGANRPDTHDRNVNYGRDYPAADLVADIAAAANGYACPTCGAPMRAMAGVEVGNIFKLGTRYSEAMGATFLDEKGESHPMVMGCYGIGTGRLMACVIEAHHDGYGIQWPVSMAPYPVALISLPMDKTPEVAAMADVVYRQLAEAGLEALYDDRDERAGVKFNDADLIGLPIRLTVGARGLKNGVVEMKVRRTGEVREIPLDNLIADVQAALDAEWTVCNVAR